MTQGTLAQLGILGWERIEPVVLAALATEEPLLLIGPHGTAKSLVLERLADALGLRLRHYNASILNFDDLVGFPVPDGDQVRYLRTPLDAWDAEVVFVDELSRCRPDLQNRLFPLIHERRLQGKRLEHLRFRWAAANPPPGPDEDPWEAAYRGAEPLDLALADRFAWVVTVPSRLDEADRLQLITGPTPEPGAPAALVGRVEQVRSRLGLVRATHGDALARYVHAAGHVLDRQGLSVSLRRLRFLFDNLVALVAAWPDDDLAQAALTALRWSLPDRARAPIDEERILAAHLAARDELRAPGDPIRIALLAEHDPINRVAIALRAEDDQLLAATVIDARASLPDAHRLVLSRLLFPQLVARATALPGLVYEALAGDLQRLETLLSTTERVHTRGPRRELHNDLSRICAGLADDEAWIADCLWASFREDTLERPAEALSFARRAAKALGEGLEEAA